MFWWVIGVYTHCLQRVDALRDSDAPRATGRRSELLALMRGMRCTALGVPLDEGQGETRMLVAHATWRR